MARLCDSPAVPTGIFPVGGPSTWLSNINRLRLGEEAQQDMQAELVVLALQARLGDAGHHDQLLVLIGQQLEEADDGVDRGGGVPLASRSAGGRLGLRGTVYRKVVA